MSSGNLYFQIGPTASDHTLTFDDSGQLSIDGTPVSGAGGSPLPAWLAGVLANTMTPTNYVLAQSPNGKQFYPAVPLRPDVAVPPLLYYQAPNGLAYNGAVWLFEPQSATPLGIYYSTDGYSWEPGEADPFTEEYGANVIQCFCWTGTKWFAGAGAGGEGASCMMSSPTGLPGSWTIEATPFDNGGRVLAMAWDGLNIVAAGNNPSQTLGIMTSTGDGTWTEQASDLGAGYGVATNGETWVVIGNDDPQLPQVVSAASSDVTTWTLGATTFTETAEALSGFVLWDGTKFWAAAPWGSNSASLLMTSADGISDWTDAGTPLGSGIYITGMGYDGTLHVFVGFGLTDGNFSDQVVGWSDDGGETWNLVYPPDPYWTIVPKHNPVIIPPTS